MIYTGDCLEHMARFASSYYDLIFADPPFNIGYKYDKYNDKRNRTEYLEWSRKWINSCYRLLKPTGSFWLAIGDDYAAELNIQAKYTGFIQRDWVIWHYTFGVHLESKFGRNHTHLFHFVKQKQHTWNPNAVRIESERQRLGDKRANAIGRVPGDVWSVPRLVGNAKERTDHPCQMPEEILERVILSTSNEGNTVLDPFAGSGTTLVVAKRLERRYDGIELSPDYVAAIERRLEGVTA